MNCATKKNQNGSDSATPPTSAMLMSMLKMPIGLFVIRWVVNCGKSARTLSSGQMSTA